MNNISKRYKNLESVFIYTYLWLFKLEAYKTYFEIYFFIYVNVNRTYYTGYSKSDR